MVASVRWERSVAEHSELAIRFAVLGGLKNKAEAQGLIKAFFLAMDQVLDEGGVVPLALARAVALMHRGNVPYLTRSVAVAPVRPAVKRKKKATKVKVNRMMGIPPSSRGGGGILV